MKQKFFDLLSSTLTPSVQMQTAVQISNSAGWIM